MKTLITTLAFAAACALALPAQAVEINLFEIAAIHRDGVFPNSQLVPDGFKKDDQGLGTLSFNFSSSGPHYIGLFVNHDIDSPANTFFNEFGIAHGAPNAGQSWEIDEPGYGESYTGDIYDNLAAGTLDNSNAVTEETGPDDISMALAWSFMLTEFQFASVTFTLSTVAPADGFYLEQHDPDSDQSIFFSSALGVFTRPERVPDAGGTLLALGLGLASLAGFACRHKAPPARRAS